MKEQPKHNESTIGPSSMLNAVKREMSVYELGGKRPHLLDKLYLALDTIPPTSTEG